MTTAHIESILSDYLTASNTQYALLLSGSWGSGKTYFWKNTLINKAKENNYKTMYISLNGLSKKEEIEKAILFALALPVEKSGRPALAGAVKLAGNIVDGLGKYFIRTSLNDIFKGVGISFIDFSNFLVCFDDLERCRIPLDEVLGFINELIEHKHLKAVIVANEEQLSKNSKSFDLVKEKLIRRTLIFKLDISAILPNVFETYKEVEPPFYEFLIINKQFILSLLLKFDVKNLRVVSFFLESLSAIFSCIDNIEATHIKSLILFTLLISIEFKEGNLTSADEHDFKLLDIIKEHYYTMSIRRMEKSTKDPDKETPVIKLYAENFYEKYSIGELDYNFYPSVYSYILSGYLNKDDLKKDIQIRQPELLSPEDQAFTKLFQYNFRDLSDDDFRNITSDILIYLEQGKYDIYSYVQATKFLYFFIDNHLIEQTKEQIDQIIYKGIDISKGSCTTNDREMENLLHFADENPNVNIIKQYVKGIHDSIIKERYKADSEIFVEYLLGEDSDLVKGFWEGKKFSNQVFQYFDKDRLLNAVLYTSNKQLNVLISILRSRYNYSNPGELLYEDADCLKFLGDEIDTYLEQHHELVQLRRFLLSELRILLSDAVSKLERTRKQ